MRVKEFIDISKDILDAAMPPLRYIADFDIEAQEYLNELKLVKEITEDYFLTRVYMLEDGFVGITGLSDAYSVEESIPFVTVYECKAIPTVDYVPVYSN